MFVPSAKKACVKRNITGVLPTAIHWFGRAREYAIGNTRGAIAASARKLPAIFQALPLEIATTFRKAMME